MKKEEQSDLVHTYLEAGELLARGKEEFSCNAVRKAIAALGLQSDYAICVYAYTMTGERGRSMQIKDVEEMVHGWLGCEFVPYDKLEVELQDFRCWLMAMMVAVGDDMAKAYDHDYS